MRRRNFKEQGKLLKAYFRMVRKFDAVIWNLYKHLWIFCCSVEYKSVPVRGHNNSQFSILNSPLNHT